MNILSSSELHTVIFVFLWKYLEGPHPGVSDRALSYVILLLNWAIAHNSQSTERELYMLADWSVYSSTDIFENAQKNVKKFIFTEALASRLDGLFANSKIDQSMIAVLIKLHIKLSGGLLKHDSILNNLDAEIDPNATEMTILIAACLKKLVQGVFENFMKN